MSESETDSSSENYVYRTTLRSEYSSDSSNEDVQSIESTENNENDESSEHMDTDSEYDSETEEMIERIYFHEQDFLDSEKEHEHYYIGYNKVSTDKQYILYANAVTPTTFFRFSINHIQYYLHEYSIFVTKPNIDIMKLFILDDHTYTVVIKTFWLRIIQRHWKKIYSQRKYCLKRRKQIKTLMHFECNGRYPPDCDFMPNLYGMLSSYTPKSVNTK